MFTTLALAAALAAPVPKAAAPDLKWRFAKGDTFYVSATMEGTVAANVPGAPGGGGAQQNNTSAAEYTYKVTVASADDKGTTLEVEFLSCKSGNGNGGVAAKLADEPKVVGQKLTFTLDAANKVTKADGDVKPGQAGGLFSPEYVQSHVQDLFRAVPGKPLGKGEKWKGNEEFALSGGIVNKRTDSGTVVGTEDGLTKLEVETENAMVGGEKGGPTFDLRGDKGKRTVLFDPQAGRVRKVTEEYAVSGNIGVGGPGGGGAQNITLTLGMKATVTVSDKEPKPGK